MAQFLSTMSDQENVMTWSNSTCPMAWHAKILVILHAVNISFTMWAVLYIHTHAEWVIISIQVLCKLSKDIWVGKKTVQSMDWLDIAITDNWYNWWNSQFCAIKNNHCSLLVTDWQSLFFFLFYGGFKRQQFLLNNFIFHGHNSYLCLDFV